MALTIRQILTKEILRTYNYPSIQALFHSKSIHHSKQQSYPPSWSHSHNKTCRLHPETWTFSAHVGCHCRAVPLHCNQTLVIKDYFLVSKLWSLLAHTGNSSIFQPFLVQYTFLGPNSLNPRLHLYLKTLSRVPLTLSLLPFTKSGRFLGSHPDTEQTGLLPLHTPFLHFSMVGPDRVNPGLQRNSPLKKFPASPSSASTTPLSSCGGWHCPDLARLW